MYSLFLDSKSSLSGPLIDSIFSNYLKALLIGCISCLQIFICNLKSIVALALSGHYFHVACDQHKQINGSPRTIMPFPSEARSAIAPMVGPSENLDAIPPFKAPASS